MGICKSQPSQVASRISTKNLTIIVLGLEKSGKTSIVKALSGVSTSEMSSTRNLTTTIIKDPLQKKNKNISQLRSIKLLDVVEDDVSYKKTWLQCYDQVHGWIFVVDASDRQGLRDNAELLDNLLNEESLRNKPFLILANKQDSPKAIDNQRDLERALHLETSTMFTIEFCTALSRKPKSRIDPSIEEGFIWLIDRITENFDALNARIETGTNRGKLNRRSQPESDESTDEKRKIHSSRLPPISQKRNQRNIDSESDTDDTKVTRKQTRSDHKQPVSYRSNFEPFPEETPWLHSTKSKGYSTDDMSSRYNSNPQVSERTKRKEVSPLTRDTKPSLHTDDDDDDATTSYSRFGTASRINRNHDSEPRTYPKYSTKNRTDDDDDQYDRNRAYSKYSNDWSKNGSTS